jgi:hypothetical protein
VDEIEVDEIDVDEIDAEEGGLEGTAAVQHVVGPAPEGGASRTFIQPAE